MAVRRCWGNVVANHSSRTCFPKKSLALIPLLHHYPYPAPCVQELRGGNTNGPDDFGRAPAASQQWMDRKLLGKDRLVYNPYNQSHGIDLKFLSPGMLLAEGEEVPNQVGTSLGKVTSPSITWTVSISPRAQLCPAEQGAGCFPAELILAQRTRFGGALWAQRCRGARWGQGRMELCP